MKNVPNILSVLRILLSAILFFLKPFSLLFWIVYFTCGFSDIIDGYIARKTNSTSRLGTILDSIADIVFFSAAMVVFLPAISIPREILVWIALIAFIKIVSLVVAYYKYRTFAILHTYTNKATGFLLFCFPFLYNSIDINILGCVICFIAGIAAIEELIIHITSRKLSRNIKGLFSKQK